MKNSSDTRKRIDNILEHIGERSSLVDDADFATLMQLISVHIYERTRDLSERLKLLEKRVEQTGADRSFLLKESYLNLFQEHCIQHEIMTDIELNKHNCQKLNDSYELDEEGMKLEEKQAIEHGFAALHLYYDPMSRLNGHSSGSSSSGNSLDSGYCSADIFNRRVLPGGQDFFDCIAAKESDRSYRINQ